MRFLTGHKGAVNAVAYSPDGTLMATGSDDKTLQLWNPVSGAWKRTKHTNAEVQTIAFHPTEPCLVFGIDSSWNRVQFYTWTGSGVSPVELVPPTHADTGGVNSLHFSPTGETLVACLQPPKYNYRGATGLAVSWRFSRTAERWDTPTPIYHDLDHPDVWAAVVSRSDRHAILGAGQGLFVQPLTAGADADIWPFPDIAGVRALAIPPARDRVAFAGGGAVGVRPFAVRDAALHWTRPANAVVALAFTPCGRSLLGGGDDGLVTVWDAATGAEHHRLDFGLGSVRGVAVNPDGLTAAACGDRGVVVFDLG